MTTNFTAKDDLLNKKAKAKQKNKKPRKSERSNNNRDRSKSTGETPAQQAKHKKGLVQVIRENLKPSVRDKRKPKQ